MNVCTYENYGLLLYLEVYKPLHVTAELGSHRDIPVILDSDEPLEVGFEISTSLGIMMC